PVVFDGDRVVGMDRDANRVGKSNQRFVDRVVDDLVDEMVKAALRRGSDVHARALAYCLEALEDLNLPGVVLLLRAVVRVPFRHVLPLKIDPYKSRNSGRSQPVEINPSAAWTQRFVTGSSFCGARAYGW